MRGDWIVAVRRTSVAFVTLDAGIGRVVVDRLEVLSLHHVGGDPVIAIEAHGDITHQVLDELGIVVGALGHVLLVGTLEDAVQLARGLALGDLDELFDPHVTAQARRDGDQRALVVSAVVGDLFRAGAQARHRYGHAQPHLAVTVAVLTDQHGAVVHQALHSGDRRPLHDEEGETHLDVAGVRLEPCRHRAQHAAEGLDRDLALGVQDLHEPRHVRALEVVRQAHVHVETGDGVLFARRAVLDAHGVADVLDAHAVDGQPPRVGVRLHVLHFGDAGACDLGDAGGRVHGYESTGNTGRSLRSGSAGGAHAFPGLQRPPALDAGPEANRVET